MLPINRFGKPKHIDLIDDAKKMGLDYVLLWGGGASRHIVDKAHENGLKVGVGMVNKDKRKRQLKNMCIDLIVTDNVDLLRR